MKAMVCGISHAAVGLVGQSGAEELIATGQNAGNSDIFCQDIFVRLSARRVSSK